MSKSHALGPGQVWSYKTRPEDTGSTLTILQIDNEEGQAIAHISIQDIMLSDGTLTAAPHSPIAEDILKESLIELLKESNPGPDHWRDGYAIWRESFDAGNAGWFTIAPAEIVAQVTVPAAEFAKTLPSPGEGDPKQVEIKIPFGKAD